MAINPADHDAPLIYLVQKLHEGSVLADRVRRHRWKRKRVAVGEVVASNVDVTAIKTVQPDEVKL